MLSVFCGQCKCHQLITELSYNKDISSVNLNQSHHPRRMFGYEDSENGKGNNLA